MDTLKEDSRYEEMRKQCQSYHKKHPKVWLLFEKFTFELIHRGFNNYGAKAVFEQIRWKTDQADIEGRSTFKVGNNHPAFYARRFMRIYPQHEGFFRTRVQTSKYQPATNRPELGPRDWD